MRTRDEMLVDVLESRRSYAWLMQAEDMLVIRLAMDVTDLLETLAEKGAEIERLKTNLKLKAMQADVVFKDNKRYMASADETIKELRATLNRRHIEGLMK